MQPVDWMMRWAEGLEPGPPNLNVRSILSAAQSRTFRYHLSQYLTRRAKDWADKGYKESVVDWPTLNARSTFWGDDQRAAFRNWEEVRDVRNPLGSAQGIAEQVQLRELLRRVIQKVMAENKLDLMIQLHSALPPGKIGLAPEPSVDDRSPSYSFGPHAGITEVLIPAGYVPVAYDATFELATDKSGRKFYRGKSSTTPTAIPAPGLPFSINFWSEPGMGAARLRSVAVRPAVGQMAIVLALAFCLVEYWSRPFPTRVVATAPAPADRWLATLPDDAVILELPVPLLSRLWGWETSHELHATHHWRRLVNGYSGFLPTSYARTLALMETFPDPPSIAHLRGLSVDYVVVRRRYFTADDYARLCATLIGSRDFGAPQVLGEGLDEAAIFPLR